MTGVSNLGTARATVGGSFETFGADLLAGPVTALIIALFAVYWVTVVAICSKGPGDSDGAIALAAGTGCRSESCSNACSNPGGL